MHGTIARKIGIFSTLGDVAIIGDMNSRVGSIQEKHHGINRDSRGEDLSRVEIVAPRNTRDVRVNTHCRKLLQLMTNYDMMLANGRICGDMAGNYTCCQRNGCSVVDMLIVQRYLLPIINYFKVLPFDWYSDHAVISKQLFLSRLDETDITAKLDSFCQTNFSDCQHAAVNFSEILSGVIKSIFRKTRCKQNRPHKSQRITKFKSQNVSLRNVKPN